MMHGDQVHGNPQDLRRDLGGDGVGCLPHLGPADEQGEGANAVERRMGAALHGMCGR